MNIEGSGGIHPDIDIDAISRELHVRPEVLKRIIAGFSKTLSEKIVQLEGALAKSDTVKMRALLHEIRGTSGNLRLAKIYSSAMDLHEAVKANAENEKLQQFFSVLKSRSAVLDEYAKKGEI